jgi:CBS domain containing-hemolysin-like protein
LDSDLPVPLAFLLAPAWGLTPQSAIALLVGLLASLSSGFMVYVAVTARIARITLRSEVVRALVGALLALVAAVLLLWLGVAVSGGTAGLANTLALLTMALGLALIFPVAGAVLAATTASRPEDGGLAFRAGTLMAEALAGWAVKAKNGNSNGSAPSDEPEFEITMASGEEVDAEEREYIENILELSDTTAHEVMTPRTDVVALDAGAGGRYGR